MCMNLYHIRCIYLGVYPHKYVGHEDNVQTGGVLRVRLYVIVEMYTCSNTALGRKRKK